MSFKNIFGDTVSFIYKRSSDTLMDGYEVFGEDVVLSSESYDQIMEPIIQKVATSTTTFLDIKLSTYLDDLDSVDEFDTELQGEAEYSTDMGLEGFRIKKKLKMIITTNKKLSTIHILSIPSEFIFEYQPNIEDYFTELKDELESLCRIIMLEDDDNLSLDAIDLKKSLLNFFEET